MTPGWTEVWAAWRDAHDVRGVSESSWYEFVERVAETLDIGPGTRVFDVGCGSGAFLYPFFENGYEAGGLDRSRALVEMARHTMPGGTWLVGEPSDLDPGQPWDVVTSCGLFESLSDLDHARGVLARMAAKALHAVAVLDVPDIETDAPPRAGHLCYDRSWMLHALAEIGASAVQVEDHRIDGDQRPGSRFNVYVRV